MLLDMMTFEGILQISLLNQALAISVLKPVVGWFAQAQRTHQK